MRPEIALKYTEILHDSTLLLSAALHLPYIVL